MPTVEATWDNDGWIYQCRIFSNTTLTMNYVFKKPKYGCPLGWFMVDAQGEGETEVGDDIDKAFDYIVSLGGHDHYSLECYSNDKYVLDCFEYWFNERRPDDMGRDQ